MEGDPPMQSLLEDGSPAAPTVLKVDFEGWRGGGRGGFVEEIWKVKLESLGPVSLRSKGWLVAELTWDLFSATADVADVNIIFYKRRLNFTHWGLRPARRRKQEDGILRKISGLFGRVFGRFFFGASLNFRWAVGTAVGTTPQSVPFAATGKWTCRGNKKVEQKSSQQLQVGVWANRYQWIYKPLAIFSAVFYWVSLGCISGPLQKWILEVDGANQLAAGFAQKLRGKRGRCLFLLWNLWGCIFGFHVHFLRVCVIFDLFFFSLPDSRLFRQLNPPEGSIFLFFLKDLWIKNPFGKSYPLVN